MASLPVQLSAQTAFERSVLEAKLRALGASGVEGQAQLDKAQLANAQVSIKDLARAAGGEALTIDALDSIQASSRWGGLKSVAIERRDPTAAQATITAHLTKLELTAQMLEEALSSAREGRSVAHTGS